MKHYLLLLTWIALMIVLGILYFPLNILAWCCCRIWYAGDVYGAFYYRSETGKWPPHDKS